MKISSAWLMVVCLLVIPAAAEENWEIAFKAKGRFLCEWLSAKRIGNGLPNPQICDNPNGVGADEAYDEVRNYWERWKSIDPTSAGFAEQRFSDDWDNRWHGSRVGMTDAPLFPSPLPSKLTNIAAVVGNVNLRIVTNISTLPDTVLRVCAANDAAAQPHVIWAATDGATYILHCEIREGRHLFRTAVLSTTAGGDAEVSWIREGSAFASFEDFRSTIVRASRPAWEVARERRGSILDRARSLRPRQPDGRLRYLNISDDEVREIQRIASEVVPDVFVYISGVTVGCPCEDGPACSAQVWVVARRADNTTAGLLLSKVSDHWAIGRVQHWWLMFDDLQSRNRAFESASEYQQAQDRLIDEFPACAQDP